MVYKKYFYKVATGEYDSRGEEVIVHTEKFSWEEFKEMLDEAVRCTDVYGLVDESDVVGYLIEKKGFERLDYVHMAWHSDYPEDKDEGWEREDLT